MAARPPTPMSLTRHHVTALLLVAVVGAVSLAGCAAGANPSAGGAGVPGFWLGLWQGFIAPIAFLVSLFNHSVGVYEVNNSGAWYDFGFLVGISAFFGGPAGAHTRRRASRPSR